MHPSLSTYLRLMLVRSLLCSFKFVGTVVFSVLMPKTAFFLVCLLTVIFFPSCTSAKSHWAETITGNWLVVYPDHRLTTQHQRTVYAKYQDSVVTLYGLQLLNFDADGGFKEMDSLHKPAGNWLIAQDSLLKIREAGKGFNPFNAVFTATTDSELLLTQYLPLEDEKIKIVWHLRKIEEEEDVNALFSPEANAWRKKPRVPQSTDELKKRLAVMLTYYGNYFTLISNKAIYFAPARVPLPLRYYRHAVQLKDSLPPAFLNLFSSEAEASAARDLLAQSMNDVGRHFTADGNFANEYGVFLKKLGAWMEKTP